MSRSFACKRDTEVRVPGYTYYRVDTVRGEVASNHLGYRHVIYQPTREIDRELAGLSRILCKLQNW